MQRLLTHKWIFVGALTLLLLVCYQCATNPVSGKKELMFISEEREIAMGAEYDPSVVSSFGLYEDAKIQQFIDEKGQEMAKVSHRPKLKYEFKVLDSPVVNAFAVPGGYVYFTRGILAHFNNEAEFAGVLGHEIGHITARHSVKQQSKQILAQAGLIVGVIASPDFGQFAGAAQQGMGLLFLKFGRDNESESDRLGVEYSTRVGYDARHMANFFNTLKRMRQQSGSEPVPNFLSTHPDPGDRYENVKRLSKEWQQKLNKTGLAENRDAYLRMIDGLVYGEDPRQGYVERNVFYHPTLKFEFPVPNGWNVVNAPSQVQIAPKDGNALLTLQIAQSQQLSEAAQAVIQNNQIQSPSRRNIRINGLSAVEILGNIQNSNDPTKPIRIMCVLIQYRNNIYQLTGLSYANLFNQYSFNFEQSILNFKELRDASKINVEPDRVRIKRVGRAMSLREALRSFRVPTGEMEELSILNSMMLDDQLKTGTLIKIVEKGR